MIHEGLSQNYAGSLNRYMYNVLNTPNIYEGGYKSVDCTTGLDYWTDIYYWLKLGVISGNIYWIVTSLYRFIPNRDQIEPILTYDLP